MGNMKHKIFKYVIQSIKSLWNCTEFNRGNTGSEHAYLRAAKLGWFLMMIVLRKGLENLP